MAQAARAGRAAGAAATALHRSLSFDVSVHSLKMATSHISLLLLLAIKYKTLVRVFSYRVRVR